MTDWKNRSYPDRYRLAGHPDQLYSVTRLTAEEGPARGVSFYAVDTGGGLQFCAMADHALDIARLSFRGVNLSFLSKNGFVAPSKEIPVENEFLHTFPGGMLYTCGLWSAGPAGRDEAGVWQPLHGRFHSLPADQCAAHTKNDLIEISGRIRETRLFGQALEVRRTISAPVGGTELVITDVLENQTPEPADYMLLYHMNFGYPFLTPELKFILPQGTKTSPRYPEMAKGIPALAEFTEPVDGAEEEVFFHEIPSEDGFGEVRLEQPALGFGVRIRYGLDTLPHLAQWKCMRSGEYVLGIEPTNSYISGRAEEQKKGTIGKIGPFEQKTMQVRLECYDL